MSKVPEGSRCVNSESGNVDCPTVNSPLLPAVPRRGFLASLAAACGLATLPSPALGTLPGELLAAFPASSTVPVMVVLRKAYHGAYSLCYVHPTMAHLTESFHWKNSQDQKDEFVIEEQLLEFHGLGRCYMAIETTIDWPPDEEEGFAPQHWLDFPTVPPDFGNITGEGRLWEGMETGCYTLEAGQITTRHAAMQTVMEENRKLCEGLPATDWKLHSEAHWWVAVEFGAEFKDECWTTIDLSIGKADFNLELACRIAVPTAAELERFGKGGAL